MQEMPWMRPDFDLRKVIADDACGAFQASLEQALDGLAARLEARRSTCRDAALRECIDDLLDACETGRDVLAAAYEAARQA